MEAPKPLETRTYHYKNPKTEFFCPLCNTPRSFQYSPRLHWNHYLQIFLLGMALSYFLYSLMSFRAFFSFFVVWVIYEGVIRSLFRKEIPCPHCGFDASWYKRDVKVARRLVHEFWEKKGSQPVN